MAKPTDVATIVDALVRAAQGRQTTSSKPWNYGWSQEDYRRSSKAAMEHAPNRGVRLSSEAREAFETAGIALLRLPRIREWYEAEELWGLLASLIGPLPIHSPLDELRTIIERRVNHLLDPPSSLVVFPVANVKTPNGLVEMGSFLIGRCDDSLEKRLREKTGVLLSNVAPSRPWWVSPPQTVFAFQCESQLNQAMDEAVQTFEDLTSLALMVQEDLDALSLFSLRGDSHRPGVRGLVVDRASLSDACRRVPDLNRDLVSEVLIGGVLGPTLRHGWYGEHPFPLEQLLTAPKKLDAVERVLLGRSVIHNRLRVAARWHAKAHWALDMGDAVLALGISFDSMLAERGPTPGRVLSERFALLDPDVESRRVRNHRFKSEYYPARSSIAHGAKGSALDAKFVRRMATDARWVFQRILAMTETLNTKNEDEYDHLYESLKWGDAPPAVMTV